MKKLIAFVLATLLTVSMAACSVSTESKDKKAQDTSTISAAESEAKAESQAESEAEKSEIAASGKIGDYEFAIESAHLAESEEGKPAIVVRYKFTNNSSETTYFLLAAHHAAYQNGDSLDVATVDEEDFKSNSFDDVGKGESIEVDAAYLLKDEKSPVDVKITTLENMFDDNGEQVSTSFDLASAK
jgi:uncharacterized protein YxeA